jgi:hypothetical protein
MIERPVSGRAGFTLLRRKHFPGCRHESSLPKVRQAHFRHPWYRASAVIDDATVARAVNPYRRIVARMPEISRKRYDPASPDGASASFLLANGLRVSFM